MDPIFWLLIASAVAIVAVLVAALVVRRRGMAIAPRVERPEIQAPAVEPDDLTPTVPSVPGLAHETDTSALDVPEAPASRLVRLRRRLAGQPVRVIRWDIVETDVPSHG